MKITGLEPIVAALPYEHGGPKPALAGGTWATMATLFVRVETDAGIVGWGEAFGFAAYCDLGASPLGGAVDAVDGSMRVPQEPGLGVNVDERVLERFRAA